MVNHRRGPWSQAEDLYLIQLVQRDGASNWVRISHAIGTRSPKQCRERYHQNLKPSLNHDPITPEEGEQIEKMVNEMGKRWAEIARRLNNRSDNTVKNWWNGGQNRRRRGHEHRRADSGSDLGYMTGQHPNRYMPEYLGHQDPTMFGHVRRTSLPVLDNNRYPNEHFAYAQQPRFAPQPYFTHPQPPMHAPIIAAPAPQHVRPAPLSLSTRPLHAFDTPIPSPASIMSDSGAPPSLITDNGSESRSPNYETSPRDAYNLASGERRRSTAQYPPKSGFVAENDAFTRVMLAPISTGNSDIKMSMVHAPNFSTSLPSPQRMVGGASAATGPLPSPREMMNGSPSTYRESIYQPQRASPGGSPSEPRKMALSSILG